MHDATHPGARLQRRLPLPPAVAPGTEAELLAALDDEARDEDDSDGAPRPDKR